jgi:hypothetical protein
VGCPIGHFEVNTVRSTKKPNGEITKSLGRTDRRFQDATRFLFH